MYLDLNMSQQPKRTRLLKTSTMNIIKPELLSSPDVQKLKLASPDLERFITNQHSLVTPTQVFFPKDVTEEQKQYVKGFEDALAQLSNNNNGNSSSNATNHHHHNDSSMSSSSSSSSTMNEDYTTTTSNNNINPINMESQEKIKLERKRQRNRIAASKCRKRKLERIAKLEDKVKQLKNENEKLNEVLDKLKSNVEGLKNKIISHMAHGCPISNYEQVN